MLAIIIPYYKLTFFEATLASLANQTNKRFKVYIGDDASAENPRNLLEKYRNKLNFVYNRFENNLGAISLTQQWERCIALTEDEEWIMVLGDDDILTDNCVEEFYNNVKEVEQKGINVIRFASQKIDEEGKTISKIQYHPRTEKAVQFLFSKTRSSLSEYVYRKQEVLQIGFKNFPLAWYSDVLAVFEFSNFDTIFSINNSIVYVRISEFSISGSALQDKLKLQAKFEFYYYLLNKKDNYFSALELKELYYRLNKCYINNKKQYSFFLKISKMYIQKILLKEYVLFLKQIVFFTKKNRINL